ncbi:MAG: head GIN domain-containing protein [Dysgonomonas sp.]
MRTANLFIICSFIMLYSCGSTKEYNYNSNAIHGNKKLMIEDIPIKNYSQIRSKTSADIKYRQDTLQDASLTLQIDENLKEFVAMRIRNNTLEITVSKNINPSVFNIYTNSKILNSIEIIGSGSFTSPAQICNKLDMQIKGSGDINITDIICNSVNLDIKGSGDIYLNNIRGKSINATVNGSGDITINGEITDSYFFVKGSGDINAYRLKTKKSSAKIAGSGDIELNISDELDASIAGSGDISYKGSPQKISKTIKGTGSIKAKK